MHPLYALFTHSYAALLVLMILGICYTIYRIGA